MFSRTGVHNPLETHNPSPYFNNELFKIHPSVTWSYPMAFRQTKMKRLRPAHQIYGFVTHDGAIYG